MKTSKLDLSELLDNEDIIAGVISEALQSNDSAVLLRTIGYVAKARGIAQIAKVTGLGRESLYKALNEDAHPRFDTILRVLNALNVQMIAVPKIRSKRGVSRKLAAAEKKATYKT